MENKTGFSGSDKAHLLMLLYKLEDHFECYGDLVKESEITEIIRKLNDIGIK